MATAVDRIEKNPILILGGTGSIGSEVSYNLALKGYQTILGSRGIDSSRREFEKLSAKIIDNGGVAPMPFYANISDPEQVGKAINGLAVDRGCPVDFLPIAAEGFRDIKRDLGEVFVRVRRSFRQNGLTREQLIAETQVIKKIAMRPEIIEGARKTNRWGILAVLDGLKQRGHIVPGITRAGTLSSDGSDYTEPENMDLYPGPWFYPPVGITKKEVTLDLLSMARNGEFIYFDVVAPPVEGTDVGNWGKDIVTWVRQVDSNTPDISFITIKDTALGLTSGFLRAKRSTEIFEKWYVQREGRLTKKRPNWSMPMVGYL